MTRPVTGSRIWPRAALLCGLAAPALGQSIPEDAAWAVGEWDCAVRSNDMPRPPGAPEIADWGFARDVAVTLGPDGTFEAHGRSTTWHGAFDETASGAWTGGPHHWAAAGEMAQARAGEGRPPVIDGATGEIVDPGTPADTVAAPFAAGGQRIGGAVVNAAAGPSGPDGIETFTLCTRR